MDDGYCCQVDGVIVVMQECVDNGLGDAPESTTLCCAAPEARTCEMTPETALESLSAPPATPLASSTSSEPSVGSPPAAVLSFSMNSVSCS
eukprot:COSAG02_NODE_2035_length_10040_cov_4.348355_1_plen_90_part_10